MVWGIFLEERTVAQPSDKCVTIMETRVLSERSGELAIKLWTIIWIQTTVSDSALLKNNFLYIS
jgi:hypothetical protein